MVVAAMWRSLKLQAGVRARTWLTHGRHCSDSCRGSWSSCQRRMIRTAQCALRQFGQDRIASNGELVTTHQQNLQRQQQPQQQAQVVPGTPAPAPAVPPLSDLQLDQLAELVHSSRRLLVLTGAGCSTESDIPDYRGPNGAYSTGFKPMTHQQVGLLATRALDGFMASPENRARYWARSFAGWAKFSSVRPNTAHEGIARLQRTGWARGLITQNVDRLHHKAGSPEVLELHGTTHEVVCMGCGQLSCRQDFQELLGRLNPEAAAAVAALGAAGSAAQQARQDSLRIMRSGTSAPLGPSLEEHVLKLRPGGEGEDTSPPALDPSWRPTGLPRWGPPSSLSASEAMAAAAPTEAAGPAGAAAGSLAAVAAAAGGQAPAQAQAMRPDGDVELDPASLGARFRVPACPACGCVLKPHVVFFGDSIPPQRAARSLVMAGSADTLMVVGSSLQVYSAFRLAKAAKEAGARLAILTAGPTRADSLLGPEDLKFETLAGASLSRLAAHPWLLVPPGC